MVSNVSRLPGLSPLPGGKAAGISSDDDATAKSARSLIIILSSVKLTDSDKSVPTHRHFVAMASGLSVSKRTVFPTPRSPVMIRLSKTVVWVSSCRNSTFSLSRPAKYMGIWPAPGR